MSYITFNTVSVKMCMFCDCQSGRNTFRQLLAETTRTLNELSQKLGKCVDKARPYYEARVKAREVCFL